MKMSSSSPLSIAELRRLIRPIEQSCEPAFKRAGTDGAVWCFGVGEIDRHLPGNRLLLNALHDITPMITADIPAALGFVAGLLSRLPGNGDILWCQSHFAAREYGGLYGPGMSWFGLPVHRLIQARARSHKELAWVMEEALRSNGLAAVIGEETPLDFTTTRRLMLACQQSATPCLFINLATRPPASAAVSRWQVAALPNPADNLEATGLGISHWAVSLERCRYGRPGNWHIHWNHETHSFHLAAGLGDGTIPAPASTAKIIPWQRRA